MGKSLFIAEKPSVAKEFAKALKLNTNSRDGFLESQNCIITWCVGHLVTMSYPEVYDAKYGKWSLDTIPFIPREFKYEVIDNVRKQFTIVSGLLNRPDVTTIYVCTDSGREGEYIYRLVEQMSGVRGKERKRVWIDSQTEEEIRRGIKEAKDLSEYDALSDAAYLRAKEDYLMGINFSRVLTLKYGRAVKDYLKRDRAVISVGRVMTCVLGMVVKREREIRAFVKTPFYRVLGSFDLEERKLEAEWKAVEGSRYYGSPILYKENGFKKKEDAQALIDQLSGDAVMESVTRKKENKNPPLLYNLAELQNDCSKLFKISPDETLRIVQELYEKKMVTYPRTDARVLSTAVAKEIHKNLGGLQGYGLCGGFAREILSQGSCKNLAKSRYVNDKQITDHYAIIPTGQGLAGLQGLAPLSARVYEVITRRFLSIFYPAAVYQKITLEAKVAGESFFANFKVLAQEGYLKVMQYSFSKKSGDAGSQVQSADRQQGQTGADSQDQGAGQQGQVGDGEEEQRCDQQFMTLLKGLKKGSRLSVRGYEIKEGETSPPKRYNSGSIILTMENAGQFIEDEELRAQIKGSGIGTSATRAEILKKLVNIEYLSLNKRTQVITPTLMGEMIFDVVNLSIRPLLDPALTASWEKGLTLVADGNITADEYMGKLDDFVTRRTNMVKGLANQGSLHQCFRASEAFYQKGK
ncbi:MAG: type IA DNA topoisomerase [Lachnospiraceae bacterium]|nr:type IA DNA topoisomerase [Lachnospiraceae bacterium]